MDNVCDKRINRNRVRRRLDFSEVPKIQNVPHFSGSEENQAQEKDQVQRKETSYCGFCTGVAPLSDVSMLEVFEDYGVARQNVEALPVHGSCCDFQHGRDFSEELKIQNVPHSSGSEENKVQEKDQVQRKETSYCGFCTGVTPMSDLSMSEVLKDYVEARQNVKAPPVCGSCCDFQHGRNFSEVPKIENVPHSSGSEENKVQEKDQVQRKETSYCGFCTGVTPLSDLSMSEVLKDYVEARQNVKAPPVHGRCCDFQHGSYFSEAPKIQNVPHSSGSEGNQVQKRDQVQRKETSYCGIGTEVTPLSDLSMPEVLKDYVEARQNVEAPPVHGSCCDFQRESLENSDDMFEDLLSCLLSDGLSLDSSGASFMSWNDDLEPNKTDSLKTQLNETEQFLYGENSISTSQPELVEECQNWKEKCPHLRVIGKSLNVCEYDKSESPAEREEYHEEIYASHGTYKEDESFLDTAIERPYHEETVVTKDVLLTRPDDNVRNYIKTHVNEELFSHLWNKSLECLEKNVKFYLDFNSNKSCSGPHKQPEPAVLVGSKQTTLLTNSSGSRQYTVLDSVIDPSLCDANTTHDRLPPIVEDNVHKYCDNNKTVHKSMEFPKKSILKKSNSKTYKTTASVKWLEDSNLPPVEKLPSANKSEDSEIPDVATPRQSTTRSMTPEVTESVYRKQLAIKEQHKKDMQVLRIYIGTWNVNGQPPSVNLSDWLAVDVEPPDIYAIGLQEIDMSKEAFIFNCTAREDEWKKAVEKALHPKGQYKKFAVIRLVGMMLVLFVHWKHRACVRDVATDTVGTGIIGKMGNKGGVGVRFDFHNTSFCFVNAHFAAHAEGCKKRNQDYHDICSRMRFRSSCQQNIEDHDQVYWFGDLNYRIADSKDICDVKQLLDSGNYEFVLRFDQLFQHRKQNNVFVGYEEGKINFQPTYKYDLKTDDWDTSKKNRVPAWCDRILWKGDAVAQLVYRSHPVLKISDHKAVSALFDSKIKRKLRPTTEKTSCRNSTNRPPCRHHSEYQRRHLQTTLTTSPITEFNREPEPVFLHNIFGARVDQPDNQPVDPTEKSRNQSVINNDIEHCRFFPMRKKTNFEKDQLHENN